MSRYQAVILERDQSSRLWRGWVDLERWLALGTWFSRPTLVRLVAADTGLHPRTLDSLLRSAQAAGKVQIRRNPIRGPKLQSARRGWVKTIASPVDAP